MEATEVAHNEAGELSIISVDGRSFVHGSILDSECAKRNAEIERLTAENERLRGAIRSTASQGMLNMLAIRKAVSFELAELIWDEHMACQQQTTTPDIMIQCRCGWGGRQSELRAECCPKCGDGFRKVP